MSLMDALLLEGFDDSPTTARNVHIALRGADGPIGSGSLADPYNGSVRLGSAMLTSLSFNPREVVFVTWLTQPHHLVAGDAVFIWATNIFTGATVAAPWSGKSFEVEWASQFAFSVILASAPRPVEQPEWWHYIWFREPPGRDPDQLARKARLFWPVASGVTSASHGYQPYQTIRISGAADPAFNGDLVAVGAGTASFKCLLTRWPTAAAGANAVSARVIYGFDEVMRSLPVIRLPDEQRASYCQINLGPGTFETRGASNGYITDSVWPSDRLLPSVGFTLKAGLKIIGSGMDATTLKLVQAVDPYDHSVALRTYSQRDGVEVADLTVDCNQGGQPCCAGVWVARVTCSAITCSGHHMRIRRVRAIHFGVQAMECFVFFIGGDLPTGAGDNVIEDCIIEKPFESNEHESSSLAISSPDPVASDNRGSVIRHNYLNFEFSNGLANHPIAVKSLLRDANDLKLVRLEAYEPHTHISSKRLVLRGAANPDFNGVFPIEAIVSDTVLTFRTWFDAPSGEGAGGQTYIGFGISSEILAGDRATFDSFEASYLTAEYLDSGLVSWLDLEATQGDLSIDPGEVHCTVTTRRPHQHVVGQTAQLKVQDPPGQYAWWSLTGNFPGAFRIVAVLSPTRLVCRLSGLPAAWHAENIALLGPEFHGPYGNGTAGVIEGNAVYDARYACYADTGSTKDGVLRDNYYSSALLGVNHSYYTPGVTAGSALVAEKHDDGKWYGVFTTIRAHGLSNGEWIAIRGSAVAMWRTGNIYINPYEENAYEDSDHRGLRQVSVDAGDLHRFRVLLEPQPGAGVAVPNAAGVAAGYPVFHRNVALASTLTKAQVAGQWWAFFESAEAHGFSTGDAVLIWGANPGGYKANREITWISNTQFKYPVAADPGTYVSGAKAVRLLKASSLTYQSGAAVFQTAAAHGFETGDYLTITVGPSDPAAYNGYFRIVRISATEFQFAPTAAPDGNAPASYATAERQVAAPLVHDTTGNVATFTTVAPHRLTIGQVALVDYPPTIPVTPHDLPEYFGHFSVTSVPTPTSFSYDLGQTQTANPPSGPFGYAPFWQTNHLMVENNVFELYAYDTNSEQAPLGISAWAGAVGSPYIFQQWLVRGNQFRHLDNAPEPDVTPPAPPAIDPNASLALRMFAADSVLMEQNIIAMEKPNLIRHRLSGAFHCFDNRKPSGELVRGQSVENTGDDPTLEDEELGDLTEQAMLLAMF